MRCRNRSKKDGGVHAKYKPSLQRIPPRSQFHEDPVPVSPQCLPCHESESDREYEQFTFQFGNMRRTANKEAEGTWRVGVAVLLQQHVHYPGAILVLRIRGPRPAPGRPFSVQGHCQPRRRASTRGRSSSQSPHHRALYHRSSGRASEGFRGREEKLGGCGTTSVKRTVSTRRSVSSSSALDGESGAGSPVIISLVCWRENRTT